MIEDGFNQRIFGKSPRIVHECMHTEISKKVKIITPVSKKIISKFTKLFQIEDRSQISNLESSATIHK